MTSATSVPEKGSYTRCKGTYYAFIYTVPHIESPSVISQESGKVIKGFEMHNTATVLCDTPLRVISVFYLPLNYF